jgi:hypothetical protein
MDKSAIMILGWMVIAPIPAGMARETPHMLRIASILPTFQIITAIGIVFVWQSLSQKLAPLKNICLSLFAACVVGSFLYYSHNYWVHYPIDWSGEWQYGYKQMIEKVTELDAKENYDRLSITGALGRPYIYFLFYNQINPLSYTRNRNANRDWYGLWNVYGFSKYDFTEKIPFDRERVLKITTAGNMDKINKLAEVKSPGGKIIFEIGEP